MNEQTENKSILKWETATEEEKATAKRVEDCIGRTHFLYNLPLQMWIEKDEDTDEIRCRLLNYMPRKEAVDSFDISELYGEMPTKEQFKDYCNTAIAIYKNLIRQFEAIRDGKIDYIYYPNTNLEKDIREGENPSNEWEVLKTPYKN